MHLHLGASPKTVCNFFYTLTLDLDHVDLVSCVQFLCLTRFLTVLTKPKLILLHSNLLFDSRSSIVQSTSVIIFLQQIQGPLNHLTAILSLRCSFFSLICTMSLFLDTICVCKSYFWCHQLLFRVLDLIFFWFLYRYAS